MVTQLNNTSWRCPVCQQALRFADGTFQCINRHNFDKAKEGYVNLLLAQHKNSKEPGDNKDMVLARREFLSQQHYLALAQALASELLTHIEALSIAHLMLFDAGCGEGYYTSIISDILSQQHKTYTISGLDISKPAVQKAAKQLPLAHFAVASSYNIPLADDSQDAVIQIFAPSDVNEIKRILNSHGIWISVNPGSEHLHQLKHMVYDQPKTHEVSTSAPQGFVIQKQTSLRFKLDLSHPQQRENLLMMTPFYWTVSGEKKQHLLANLQSVDADFDIKIMTKVNTQLL